MSKLLTLSDGIKTFYCPGCKCSHEITDGWTLTGDDNNPIVTPSILCKWEYAGVPIRCHLFIKQGKIEYLSDCTHEFAGKTIDMEDIEGVVVR